MCCGVNQGRCMWVRAMPIEPNQRLAVQSSAFTGYFQKWTACKISAFISVAKVGSGTSERSLHGLKLCL